MTTNAFAAICARCNKRVEPGDGLVSGGKSSYRSANVSDWRVVHNACIPVVDLDAIARPWIRGLEYDL